ILRIMDANDNLIRRYSPANTVPETLQLVEGSYSATLAIGSQAAATMDASDCYYWGESEFTVGESTTKLNLDAKIYNTAIKVVFGDSVVENFEEGYSVVAIFEEGGDEEVSLTFTADESGEMGYFLDYENDYAGKKITWQFSGVRNRYSTDYDTTDRSVVVSGEIVSPAIGELNTLSFKYIPYYIDANIGLTVDVNPTVFDDNLDFVLQPTVTLADYSGSTIGYMDQDILLNINSSVNDIAAVSYTDVDGTTFTIPLSNESIYASDYNYEYISSKSGVLTLKSSAFMALEAGLNEISVSATDIQQSTGSSDIGLFCSGLINLDWDTWTMSATFDVAVAWSEQSSAKVQYSAKDSGVWVDAAGDIEYNDYGAMLTVEAAPSWSSAQNSSGLTYYHSPVNGIVVNNSYEYRVVVGDSDIYPISGEFTASGGTPDFVDGDFENTSLPCFYYDGSEETSTTWASGNNSNATSLCAQVTFSDRSGYGVEMAGTETGLLAWTYLGAGNLFYGQFEMGSTDGTVKFGQPFDWESRPLKVRFDYAAYLGAVDYNDHATYIAKNATDQGRIYVAVVNWSGRQETNTGTSSVSGAWDPIDNDSSKGKVIGYASLFVGGDDQIGVLSSSSRPSDLITRELDFYYYDTETKPSGAITLVVSCSSSAYGHYFNGSTESKMWIDELELVY
ncbi:MAG: PCMD domain-containing protein, partial [Rikenellaceae bacterium]